MVLPCRLITLLHGLHRSMYMGERMAYYERRAEVSEMCLLWLMIIKCVKAVADPDNVLSMILDGMAQNHSVLPWLGNLKTLDKHIQQHIIGVLTHGQDVKLYR